MRCRNVGRHLPRPAVPGEVGDEAALEDSATTAAKSAANTFQRKNQRYEHYRHVAIGIDIREHISQSA